MISYIYIYVSATKMHDTYGSRIQELENKENSKEIQSKYILKKSLS